MNLYNEERKLRFLEESASYRNARDDMLNIFAKASRYERKFDADICDMDQDQLVFLFDQVGGLTVKRQKNIRSVLATYVNWCKDNGYCSVNLVNQVAGISADKVRMYMVANPAHLKTVLDVVFDRAEFSTIQYIYRSILWLAFIGFGWSEVLDLKTEHVDFERSKIIYTKPNGYTVWGVIPPEALEDIRYVYSARTITYDRGSHSGDKDRADGSWLVRTTTPFVFDSEDDKINYIKRTFRPALSKAFKQARAKLESTSGIPKWCALDITFDTVLRSGVFYRQFELERAGLEVNLRNIYQVRFANGKIDESEFATFQYVYSKNYSQWRNAFG